MRYLFKWIKDNKTLWYSCYKDFVWWYDTRNGSDISTTLKKTNKGVDENQIQFE